MKKRFLSILLACSFMVSLAACSTTKSNNGTNDNAGNTAATGTSEYTGTAKGFGGDVAVTLSLDGKTLTNVTIVGADETPNIGGAAMDKMVATMMETGSVNVDAVSGATVTSEGVFAAVNAALEAAGLTSADFAAAVVKTGGQTIQKSTSLLVVGAGGAGLTCATAAMDSGITDVLILEKMSYVGGATSVAGGIDAGMSKLQEELGLTGDSYQLIHDDIMASGENHNEDLVWIMANNQGATLDWLKEEHNVPFNERYASDFPEHTVQRFFTCEGGMTNAMSILADEFMEKGGEIAFETKATELIQDETGKVIGAKATDADGNTLEITADAVVIATGGYGANQEMISQNEGHLQYAVFYGVQSSMGEGQLMGQAIGAKMLNMGYAKMYPNGISQPGTNNGKATPMPTLTTVNSTGAIFVNTEGDRFVNENLPFADIKNATCEQPNEIMYLVMNQAGYDIWSTAVAESQSAAGRITMEQQNEYFESDENQPTFTRGTLEEAAAAAGIDAEQIVKTVEEWNQTVENGTDEFGRENLYKLDTTGTVYIIEQKLRFATTLGGFDITANFECQTEDGQVIPGLYAIGEVVGGANGTEAIPGSMACWAVTSGRVCGEYLGTQLND